MMKESSEKLNNQAIKLASEGSYDEAIACFMRALSLENQNYLLWFNLGLTYRDSGDFEDARNAMEKAFELNPEDEEIIETLAILNYDIGNLDDALKYCILGLEFNENNIHLWNTIGVIYFNDSDFGSASEAFEQALSINPYYYDALYNLRDTYEELKNTAGVDECTQRLNAIKRN